MSKLSHDRSQCIHCGACVSVCPEFFEDTGEITLKGGQYDENNLGVLEIDETKKSSAESAVSVCPVGCIKLE